MTQPRVQSTCLPPDRITDFSQWAKFIRQQSDEVVKVKRTYWEFDELTKMI